VVLLIPIAIPMSHDCPVFFSLPYISDPTDATFSRPDRDTIHSREAHDSRRL
jgi:hypothetical protein